MWKSISFVKAAILLSDLLGADCRQGFSEWIIDGQNEKVEQEHIVQGSREKSIETNLTVIGVKNMVFEGEEMKCVMKRKLADLSQNSI